MRANRRVSTASKLAEPAKTAEATGTVHLVPTNEMADEATDLDTEPQSMDILTTDREPEPTPPDLKAIEEGGGDSTLARYFRDMALHDVMGPEEELRTAVDVEQSEIEHWSVLLSFLPSVELLLDGLDKDVETMNEADRPPTPQVGELRKLVKNARKTKFKLSAPEQRRWNELTASLAQAVRLPDSDRIWMARALETARRLGGAPTLRDDDDLASKHPAIAQAPGLKKWLSRSSTPTTSSSKPKTSSSRPTCASSSASPAATTAAGCPSSTSSKRATSA
jgi:RNA polymerase primary sigma factor